MVSSPPQSHQSSVRGRDVVRGWATAGVASVIVAVAWTALQFQVAREVWVERSGLAFAWAAAAALLLGPVVELSRVAYLRFVRRLEVPRRRLKLMLSVPLFLLAWWTVGQLALRLLVAFEDRPGAGAVLLSTLVLGILSFTNWLSDRAAPHLPGRWLESLPSPHVTTALSALGLVLGMSVLVAFGTTSGSGNPLALFGVFRRPELDLSPVWFSATWFGTSVTLHLLTRRVALAPLLVALVVSLACGGWALSRAAHVDAKLAVSIERAGGIPAQGLAVLRIASDRDGDGVSPYFGGGDCNDQRKDVHPGAIDRPENGVDEDCSGSDRRLETQAPEPLAKPQAVELPKNLNFVLLTVDTLRADVGFNGPIVPGHEVREGLTPRLDALAAKSTVFERAYSLASYTSKSLGPMLIGKYPSETARSFEHFDRFAKDELFVQERLQSQGTSTISVQGYWYFFMKSYGLERGWDTLNHEAAPRYVSIEGDKSSNGKELATQAIAELERLAQDDRRFYLWTHWVDPHSEYVRHPDHDFGGTERERYDSEVSMVDAQIGRIVDALEKNDLLDETVIMVTSDHGEAFGEHGMIRHGFEVWEELVRVPLLLYVPGMDARRVTPRRSLIDTVATILDVFEIEPFDEMAGTSLLNDVLAEEGEWAERPVLVDMPEGPNNRERRAFYRDDMKLIMSNGRAIGLYDLAKDPEEKQDLSDQTELLEPIRKDYQSFVDQLDVRPAR